MREIEHEHLEIVMNTMDQLWTLDWPLKSECGVLGVDMNKLREDMARQNIPESIIEKALSKEIKAGRGWKLAVSDSAEWFYVTYDRKQDN